MTWILLECEDKHNTMEAFFFFSFSPDGWTLPNHMMVNGRCGEPINKSFSSFFGLYSLFFSSWHLTPRRPCPFHYFWNCVEFFRLLLSWTFPIIIAMYQNRYPLNMRTVKVCHTTTAQTCRNNVKKQQSLLPSSSNCNRWMERIDFHIPTRKMEMMMMTIEIEESKRKCYRGCRSHLLPFKWVLFSSSYSPRRLVERAQEDGGKKSRAGGKLWQCRQSVETSEREVSQNFWQQLWETRVHLKIFNVFWATVVKVSHKEEARNIDWNIYTIQEGRRKRTGNLFLMCLKPPQLEVKFLDRKEGKFLQLEDWNGLVRCNKLNRIVTFDYTPNSDFIIHQLVCSFLNFIWLSDEKTIHFINFPSFLSNFSNSDDGHLAKANNFAKFLKQRASLHVEMKWSLHNSINWVVAEQKIWFFWRFGGDRSCI